MINHETSASQRFRKGKRNNYLLFLMIVVFISRAALMFRPETQLTVRPYQDDAYYALTCGYHLAQGHGFSIDGVHPTNGVQPLIVLLYSGIFKIAANDKWLGVRLTFILVGIIDALCVFAIYRLILSLYRKKTEHSLLKWKPENIAATLWTGLASLSIITDCGLETGLYSALILFAFLKYSFLFNNENESKLHIKKYLLFGVLLGFMVLSRIDGVLIVVAFSFHNSIYRLYRKKTTPFLPGIIFSLTALLITLPWWYYNYSTFGNIVPISGLSESIGNRVIFNVLSSTKVIADILLTIIYYPFDYLLPYYTIPYFLATLLITIFLFWRFDLWRKMTEHFSLSPLQPLLYAGFGLLIYYTFFFSAPHFIGRYLQPLRIYWIIIFSLALPFVREVLQTKFGRSASIAFSLICGSILLSFNAYGYIRNFIIEDVNPAYQLGMWAKQHPQELMGVTSSGTAGFVADNVINLDGKVNADALHSRIDHTLGDYVISSGITVLADWDIKIVNEQMKQYRAKYELFDSIGTLGLYRKQGE